MRSARDPFGCIDVAGGSGIPERRELLSVIATETEAEHAPVIVETAGVARSRWCHGQIGPLAWRVLPADSDPKELDQFPLRNCTR